MNKQENLIQIIVDICTYVLLKDKTHSSDYQIPVLAVEDWEILFSIASMHGVLPIIVLFFENIKVEDKDIRKVVLKWYSVAQGNKQRYRLQLQTIYGMAHMFAEKGLDMMILKGTALAQLYPSPDLRVFSDIDYYLFGKSKLGIETMKENNIDNSAYFHHHTQASLNGVLLENHYDFVERIYHDCDIILDDTLKELAEIEGRSHKATFLNNQVTNVYLMTPTMNAIFLIRHMSAHFVSESISLRMLNDWILFLKHCSKDVEWKRVVDLYEKSGMMEFVGIVMELIRQHFHVEFPNVPIESLMNEHTNKVWKSIVYPPDCNPYKKNSLSYWVHETKTFLGNRWKHQIVYPGESYLVLSFHYAWSVIKRKLGLLRGVRIVKGFLEPFL